MARPTYTISADMYKAYSIDQSAAGGTSQALTTTAGLASYFNPAFFPGDPFGEKIILFVWLRRVGVTVGTVYARLKLGTPSTTGTIIATSNETYTYNDLPVSNTWYRMPFTFDLNSYSYGYQLSQAFNIEVLGTYTNPAEWFIEYSTTEQTALMTLYQLSGTTWSTITGDMRAILAATKVETHDLTSYFKTMTINRGKSDIDGKFVSGTCEIGLNNNDGRFSPLNTSGPYYGYWDVNAKITVTGNDGSDFPIYRGYVDRIRPDFLFKASRDCYINCSDIFERFKNVKISLDLANLTPGLNGGIPVHDALEAALIAGGWYPGLQAIDKNNFISLYPSKAWSGETLLDVLEEIVEWAQGSHFIDGEGKYTYKDSDWLSVESTDFDWSGPECADCDDYKIEHDIKGALNRIVTADTRSPYNSAEYFDAASVVKYGQVDFIYNSDLWQNPTYPFANINNQSLIDDAAKSYRQVLGDWVGGADFQIKDRDSDVRLDVGDVIKFNWSAQGLTNQYYVILKTKRKVEPAGNWAIDISAKEFSGWPETINTASDITTVYSKANYSTITNNGYAYQFTAGKSGWPSLIAIPFNVQRSAGTTITYNIVDDSAGTPGTTNYGAGTVPGSYIHQGASPLTKTLWNIFSLNYTPLQFTAGNKYWVLFRFTAVSSEPTWIGQCDPVGVAGTANKFGYGWYGSWTFYSGEEWYMIMKITDEAD